MPCMQVAALSACKTVARCLTSDPMAAKAAEQERRRREAVEAKRYKSVMGTTPQDLLRRVEPPPAEMTETPQSVMPTTLDRAVVGGLRALGAPAPQARGINQLLSKSVGMLVPDPSASITRCLRP